MRPHHCRRSSAGRAVAAALVCLLGTAPVLIARQSPAPEAAVPFQSEERLAYRVLWSKYEVQAATIDFDIVERRNFYGHPSWHFRAVARTLDTIRIIYPLDDQFDSYAAMADLTTLQYEMYLREQGQQHTRRWRLNGDEREQLPSDVAVARVLPGTRDPVGLLYALRAADWKEIREFRTPVFDGHRLYQIVARTGVGGEVTVPAGQFVASQIDIEVFERGRPAAGTRFSVWLAQDEARTPVLIEADVPIGTARVELTSLP